MKKLFCIVSPSGAGKDSVAREVGVDLKLPIATSFTTRPMRSSETEGVEYNFISEEKFWDLDRIGEIAEWTEYVVADDSTWYYGLTRTELEKGDYVLVIVNKDGLAQLQEIYGDRVVSVFIEADGMIRLKRTIERDTKANPLEICRRFLADHNDMKDVVCDYIVYNEGELREAVDAFKKIILTEMNKEG